MVNRSLGAVALTLLLSSPAQALFHLAHISELSTQAGGVQYVEIEMNAGAQRFVTNSVLGAWDCTGNYLGDVLLVPGDVANSGSGVRWIMATSDPVGSVDADFLIPAADIDTTCGQVCWGAPGLSVPDPGSWEHTDPNQYVDCVAYGGYSGPTHDDAGTPTPLPPGDTTYALVRVADSADNAADFALACPTPENNDGEIGEFGDCTEPSTTTTIVTGTTTTTTLPGTGATDLISARKLLLRAKPDKPEKSALVLLSKRDAGLTLGRGEGSNDDPIETGGRLLVGGGSANGAFLGRYQLPAGGWTRKTKGTTHVGWIFRGDDAVRSIKLIEGKLLKIKGRGRELNHELATDPNPVRVVLEIGEHAYCMELGGTTKHKADKLYKARNAPAPASSAGCDAIR